MSAPKEWLYGEDYWILVSTVWQSVSFSASTYRNYLAHFTSREFLGMAYDDAKARGGYGNIAEVHGRLRIANNLPPDVMADPKGTANRWPPPPHVFVRDGK